MPEVLCNGGAPDALMTVDDGLRGRIELFGPELDLFDRDVDRVVEPADPRLPVLPDIEQDRSVVLVEAQLEVGGTDLGQGRLLSVAPDGR